MGDENWSRGKIRYHLEQKGYATLTEIDAKFGLRPSAVSSAIRFPVSPGERVIAQIIGVHPMVIWPNRYDARGVRLSPQPSASYSAVRVVGKRLKNKAA